MRFLNHHYTPNIITGILNFGIGIPIFWLSRHRNFKRKFPTESSESKTESEFRLRWGSQKSEPKIEIPNQVLLLVANNFWTRSFSLGYWLFYFSSVLFWLRWRKITFAGKRLSQVSMYVAFFYPCHYWGQSIFVTVGSFIMLGQIVAGSIMVRHMKSILVSSLPLRVYYLIRCTHNALWGVLMTSDSTWPSSGCVSCFWQDLQDLTLLGGMCIPFQNITDFIVSLRLEWLGCWR